MISRYYRLTKPGIIYGNVLVAAAGFAYASHGSFNWGLFALTLAGLACVVASACVFNNYYDRALDAKMTRTQNRALVVGSIANKNALMFCGVLLVAGVALLFFTTTVALCAALIGFVVYTAAYTPLKHITPYALFVGAVAGATPPVVGYAAVTNTFDQTAALLFLFLFIWQLPHFVAIGVYRADEYAAGGVPLFTRGPYSARQKKYGRWVFYASLVILLGWCAALAIS